MDSILLLDCVPRAHRPGASFVRADIPDREETPCRAQREIA